MADGSLLVDICVDQDGQQAFNLYKKRGDQVQGAPKHTRSGNIQVIGADLIPYNAACHTPLLESHNGFNVGDSVRETCNGDATYWRVVRLTKDYMLVKSGSNKVWTQNWECFDRLVMRGEEVNGVRANTWVLASCADGQELSDDKTYFVKKVFSSGEIELSPAHEINSRRSSSINTTVNCVEPGVQVNGSIKLGQKSPWDFEVDAACGLNSAQNYRINFLTKTRARVYSKIRNTQTGEFEVEQKVVDLGCLKPVR